jgi:DNA-binding response OmpR family regulator
LKLTFIAEECQVKVLPEAEMSDTKTVLIVDDDADIRTVVRMRLEAAQYHILEAPDGHSAVLLARTENPDLLLLDLTLPVMSGMDVLQALRDDPTTARIPVIVMSGKDESHNQRSALSLGAHAYVIKPLDGRDLLAKIQEVLSAEVP